MTKWNASDACPPCASGLVSGPMIFSCSMTSGGPSVRDDHGQRLLMLRTNVYEMNVQPVDLGDELRQGVEPRLDLAPVVARQPVLRELPGGRELHALRLVGDLLAIGPACRLHAPLEVGQRVVGNLDAKRADGAAVTLCARRRRHQAREAHVCRRGKKVAPIG